MKKILQKAANNLGYSISGEPRLINFLRSREIDLVIDVGANAGQFATALRDSGYKGRIFSFEPIASVFAELSRRMAQDKAWAGKAVALGETRSRGMIEITQDTVFSSLASQTEQVKLFGDASKVQRCEDVEVMPLDDIFGELDGNNVFLKIDTQGLEEAVLRGARASLPKISGLQVEIPIQQLYGNTWSLPRALSMMEDYGFMVAQMHPSSLLPDDPACWTEVDCVFKRR